MLLLLTHFQKINSDETIQIRRGTWFLADTLQPIDSNMADSVEAHHLHIFRFQTIPDAPVFSEKETSKKPSYFFMIVIVEMPILSVIFQYYLTFGNF